MNLVKKRSAKFSRPSFADKMGSASNVGLLLLPRFSSLRLWRMSIPLFFIIAAHSADAEKEAAVENGLFKDNIEKLVHAVRYGTHIHIGPARAYPNDHEKEQVDYCSRLVAQIRETGRPASDFMPKPIYSTARQGNEFIRSFFLKRVSRCERNQHLPPELEDGNYGYASMFDKKWGEPYFRVYANPKRPGSHVLMQILVTNPRPEARPVEEFAGSFYMPKGSKESCFHFDEANLGGPYPGGPNSGVLLFDGEIMAYSLGTTDAHCPEDYPCPKHDFDMSRTYFLRLFPPNATDDLFGPSYLKALENGDVDSVTWNPNYICTIYFD